MGLRMIGKTPRYLGRIFSRLPTLLGQAILGTIMSQYSYKIAW